MTDPIPTYVIQAYLELCRLEVGFRSGDKRGIEACRAIASIENLWPGIYDAAKRSLREIL